MLPLEIRQRVAAAPNSYRRLRPGSGPRAGITPAISARRPGDMTAPVGFCRLGIATRTLAPVWRYPSASGNNPTVAGDQAAAGPIAGHGLVPGKVKAQVISVLPGFSNAARTAESAARMPVVIATSARGRSKPRHRIHCRTASVA